MADDSAPKWTPDELRAFARDRLVEDSGRPVPDWTTLPEAGPNPIDENDRELMAGR